MIFRIKTFLNFLIATVFNLVPYKSILFNSYRAYSIEEKLKLRIPYTNLQLINFFKDFSNENKNITIFEYGSGSSTLFFEDYFTNIYSVEHDENWFKVISKYIKKAKVFFVPPVNCENPTINSRKIGYKNSDFTDYVNFIEKIGLSFDIIFIDGRARQDCLKIANNYLKPNGIIVLDDSNRNRYKKAIFDLFPNNNILQLRGFGTYIPLLHQASIIF